jgi:BlaI family transcriptional regulator, penicillinase repressor
MAKLERLAPAEWEIMEAIWQMGDARSVREIMEFLYPDGAKAYTTVQTIMTILEKKGFLRRKKIGLVHFYSPVQSREDIVSLETNDFVHRLFSGSVPSLASHLLRAETLSMQELQEIKSLLRKKEDELKGKIK